jgi:hypothetical protein
VQSIERDIEQRLEAALTDWRETRDRDALRAAVAELATQLRAEGMRVLLPGSR